MNKKISVGQIYNRNEEVSIGDFVGFKNDVENYGKIVAIEGPWLTLSVHDGITGEKYTVQEHRTRCWVD